MTGWTPQHNPGNPGYAPRGGRAWRPGPEPEPRTGTARRRRKHRIMLAVRSRSRTLEVALTSAQNATDAASVPQAEVYRAARQDKPWGHELIFAAIGGKYIGKIIHVNAGHSLSLQYHREKEETISVMSGEALIQYGPSADRLTDQHFAAGDTIHLPPGVPRPIPDGARTWSVSRTTTGGPAPRRPDGVTPDRGVSARRRLPHLGGALPDPMSPSRRQPSRDPAHRS